MRWSWGKEEPILPSIAIRYNPSAGALHRSLLSFAQNLSSGALSLFHSFSFSRDILGELTFQSSSRPLFHAKSAGVPRKIRCQLGVSFLLFCAKFRCQLALRLFFLSSLLREILWRFILPISFRFSVKIKRWSGISQPEFRITPAMLLGEKGEGEG